MRIYKSKPSEVYERLRGTTHVQVWNTVPLRIGITVTTVDCDCSKVNHAGETSGVRASINQDCTQPVYICFEVQLILYIAKGNNSLFNNVRSLALWTCHSQHFSLLAPYGSSYGAANTFSRCVLHLYCQIFFSFSTISCLMFSDLCCIPNALRSILENYVLGLR